MKYKLISGDNPKMETPSEEVMNIKKARSIGNKMFRFLASTKYGVGLSAVQLGIMKRIFVVNYLGQKMLVINPVIVSYSKEKKTIREYCLSYPGKSKNIKRSIDIQVEYHDGKVRKIELLTGMMARIFQHEYDHLNGKSCVK